MLAGQLVASQTESVADDLLVEHAPDLEEDLVDGHSRGPVIERSLSFTHTHLVSADKDADVAGHALVEAVLLPAQALLDGVLGDLELLGRDAAVVVRHAQPVVAPDDGGAARGAPRGAARAALHHLLLPVDRGLQPRAGPGGRGGEGADAMLLLLPLW